MEIANFESLREAVREQRISLTELAGLLKDDLCNRFDAGSPRSVNAYLHAFPELGEYKDLVVSLVYEEYCLREECGEEPDPESFCDRYAPWRDSLASQLQYHRLLSQAAGRPMPMPMPKPKFPEPGEIFCGYRLRAVLGEGGSARVYLANQPNLPSDYLVALKVSLDRGTEPAIMSRLEHDHIVPVLSVEVDRESGMRGLCMPYSPGLTLDRIVGRMAGETRAEAIRLVLSESRGKLIPKLSELDSTEAVPTASDVADSENLPNASVSTLRDAQLRSWDRFPARGSFADGVAWIGMKLAKALAHAHQQKIFHLDVKPANVLLSWRHGPRLLDFNLAHDPHTPPGAEAALRGGTLPYMAPEQLRAFLNPDRWDEVGSRSDLYSLGLVLTELLVGKPTEAVSQSRSLPRAIADTYDRRMSQPTSVRLVNPSVPRALDAIISKCLAYDPADRYATGDELAEDLRRYLQRHPLLHARPDRWADRAFLFMDRNRAQAIGAGALVLTMILILVARMMSPSLPLVARYEFLNGTSSYYAGRPRQARTELKPLLDEHPDSPLLHLYLGAVAEAVNELPIARRHYLEATRSQRIPDEFLEWFRSDTRDWDRSKFAAMLGNAARTIAEMAGEKGLKDDEEREKLLLSARRGFEQSLRLNPELEGSYAGLASVAEHMGEYAVALNHLDKAIGLTTPELAIGYHLNRARLLILMAESHLKEDRNSDLVRSRLGEVSQTLKAITLKADDDLRYFYMRDFYYPTKSQVRLADLLRAEGKTAEAAELYRLAEASILSSMKEWKQSSWTSLLDEIQESLKSLAVTEQASVDR